ncbi:enoyl-CoA hydratase/isomerase family protein [Moheibacter lacus]|uniref:Enoyl-CoA hydratase/isomerase family protein n=1 Tax=Moheibacter lacus TaxID=2745851 RepID=A0A838ZHB3_9FLAO|nr:enoyl-CoA hydratase/isomerase family protein [Moheibacter lacus]MBA5628648.1 enoyl-CoA hydratase/isomerase family protein [Moheibacter lacus]
MESYYIKSDILHGIATIEFHHPKSNSFPSTQLHELIRMIDDLGQNDEVKIIILKSEGDKVFSAGASFDELLTIDEFSKGKKFFLGFANVILAMRRCPKFIVGCITGKVVGGGVGLASACDYALADENAAARLSELSIGIGPFVIEPAITRKIGITAFSEMTMNPTEWKSPQWLKEKGIYNHVYADAKTCEEETLSFARNLSVYSLEAMRDLKSIFWQGTDHLPKLMEQRAEMSGRLVLSDFTKETLLKFKSK